jgi:peptidoglycan/xylan/chitin deacetylase (PgdA/CDA1 family)
MKKIMRIGLSIALIFVVVANTAWGGTATRKISITFDDLPAVRLRESNEALANMTRKLIAHIERHGIPAVGLVNEEKLYRDGDLDEERVALLSMWCEAGYELGNHTYSHMDLHRSTLDEFKDDVIRGEEVTRPLLEACGMKLRYFRHPLLHTGLDLETKQALEIFLDDRGYRIAPVTIDNSEWIYAKAYYDARVKSDSTTMGHIAGDYLIYMNAMVEYYEQQSRALFGREIPQVLLLHANYINADHFGDLAGLIAARGYQWISLEEAIADEAYNSPDTYTGSGGITWIHRWAITAGKKGEFFGSEPTTPQWIAEAAGMDYD